MTLIFGQFPQRAFVSGQFVSRGIVGSVTSEVDVPDSILGSGPPARRRRMLIRHNDMSNEQSKLDEEVMAAITVFITLETN
jgi:hypothetical protein